jgi:hypothetical protein
MVILLKIRGIGFHKIHVLVTDFDRVTINKYSRHSHSCSVITATPSTTRPNTRCKCARPGVVVELIDALDIGGVLSLSTMVEAMLDSKSAWEAVATFCENVIKKKNKIKKIYLLLTTDGFYIVWVSSVKFE